MSGLAVMYSKEIAKELTKIPVVLPGEELELGQIIHFPFGKSGIWPFRKPAPQGAFSIITSLKELDVETNTSNWKRDADSYIFSSRKDVITNANFGAQGTVNPNANVEGSLNISFKKEGAVYFAAIDCDRTDLLDLQNVQVDLEKYKNKIIWNETFLVTSITRAKRALIMQSSTSSASLNISGEIKGLITKEVGNAGANLKIGVDSFKESAFIKPWSEDVTVFIGLHRFTKKKFGFKSNIKTISKSMPFNEPEADFLKGQFVNSDQDMYQLEEVSPTEILQENYYDSSK